MIKHESTCQQADKKRHRNRKNRQKEKRETAPERIKESHKKREQTMRELNLITPMNKYLIHIQ